MNERFLHDINADLHAHSTASDGTLTPTELVARAKAQGVELFALTDHDEVRGLPEARSAAAAIELPFVPSLEISVTWAAQTVHIVGLGVDPNDANLQQKLTAVRSGRLGRARAMGQALAAVGIDGAFDGALALARNPGMLSRTHFARHLVARGICSDVRTVFERFMVPGKPGYVEQQWARLSDAVAWIDGAGGVAVLAHPARYKFDETRLWALFSEFKEAGGGAVEIATSNHTATDRLRFTAWAREFDLEGSRGSDFHGPGESHAELGKSAPLPDTVVPVWHRFVG